MKKQLLSASFVLAMAFTFGCGSDKDDDGDPVNGNPNLPGGGSACVSGTKLKATSGWNDYEGQSDNGTDDYGFSALPGGLGYPDGDFRYVGDTGNWWSSTEGNASFADIRYMGLISARVNGDYLDKAYLLSVRCVQN